MKDFILLGLIALISFGTLYNSRPKINVYANWTYEVDGVKLIMPVPPKDEESAKLAKKYLVTMEDNPLGSRLIFAGGPVMQKIVQEKEVKVIVGANNFIVREGFTGMTPIEVAALVESCYQKFKGTFPDGERVSVGVMLKLLESSGYLRLPEGLEEGQTFKKLLIHNVIIEYWSNDNIQVDPEDLLNDKLSKPMDLPKKRSGRQAQNI